jgi:chorismate mutase/prephenate dehydratase
MSNFNDPSNIDALKQIRGEITRIDEQILNLLSERRRLSHAVAATKDLNTAIIRDPSREEDLLVSLVQNGRQKGLDSHFVTRVFHEIIDDSVRIQQEYFQRAINQGDTPSLRVAIQGIEGSYSSTVTKKYLSRRNEGHILVECQRHSEVIEAVEQGRADLGVLPIENTNTGAYGEVYDLLLQTNLHIVGEEKIEIRYCLLSPQVQPISNIRKIYCHAQAAAQCSQFLSKLPDVTIENYPDSAISVRKLKDEGISEYAAIASEEAAQLYGLNVLSTQIANTSRIYTRYVVVARKPMEVDKRIPCKTSIVMATHHKAGALLESLQVFRDYEINLAKLESRPIEGNPWEELFYVDFDGNMADPSIREAMNKLATVTRFLKVLGCYPAGELSRTQPPKKRIRSHEPQQEPSPSPKEFVVSRMEFQVHGHVIGGNQPVFIAGPDTFGSMSQFSRLARIARDSGVDLLRIGCTGAMGDLALQTSVEEADLQMARETADGYNMGLVIEVSSVNDIELVSRYADLIQVGAWNMRNNPLLRGLGRQTKPVILYRNIASGIEEFVEAANWILQEGNRQVILCDAGIKRFDGSGRTIIDPASICELSESTGLPILLDLRNAAKDTYQQVMLAKSMRSLPVSGLVFATDWYHSTDEASLLALSAELNETISALEGSNQS